MIQRIQTLWLFLVFVMATLMMFFPIASFSSENHDFILKIFSIESSKGIIGLPNPSIIGILSAISSILAIGNIMQFKNRKLQIKINMIAMLINIGLLLAIFFISDKIAALENVSDIYKYEFGSYLPIVSVFLLVMANRSIRKDEALVKQSDRIR